MRLEKFQAEYRERAERCTGGTARLLNIIMNKPPTDKHCHFCVNQLNVVDWKDIPTLQRFMSHYNRIVPGRRTGLCAKHQRKVTIAIKRAREMGMMPFVRK